MRKRNVPFAMRKVRTVPDTEEAKARSRLLAHFVDHPTPVFYSRQLDMLFEDEFFHWVTNRALRGLIKEGHVLSEARRLDIGSEIKLVWIKSFRFYKRAATEVIELVNQYTSSATERRLCNRTSGRWFIDPVYLNRQNARTKGA